VHHRGHRGDRLLCRRVVGRSDVADDVAQEASLQALLNLDRLRHPDRFGPWLAGIGLNLCRRWLRERARGAWSLEALQGGRWGPEPVDQDPTPEEAAEAAEMTEAIRRALAHLPPDQRDAVMLFYVAGLTQQEIADALGTTAGAVKARLHKARRRLRDQLSILWKEEDMGVRVGTEWLEMQVTDVRRAPADGARAERYVVLLQKEGRDRGLPIWVGPFEGTAIAMILEEAELPRPATYSFAASVLHAVGGRLREVRITRLADITYYAEAVLEGPADTATVDARPSDAIALALLSGAPVRVSSALMEPLEEKGKGSWEEFQQERERYGAGARDIAEERKSAWERDMEEFRKSNR
jgi:RNA polymerase sigma factor (sigma-70 family)